MGDKPKGKNSKPDQFKTRPTVSSTLNTGEAVELIYDPQRERTAFAIGNHTSWSIKKIIKLENGTHLIPYSPENNLIRNKVILLPATPADYTSEEELVAEILNFIHRYVDVSERFERISAYYVMFSWVFDCFNELPYLRVRGDYGSGKTRFLLIVGSLCYKPIFASGASTTSPIFHMLDAFGGTLIVDEADFRFSDEKADIIKIFNIGNVRGIPVLRTEVSRNREFNPRAFHVFGPKIIATRGTYDDRALESRFITEEMGGRKLRKDIPLNLTDEFEEEARKLRNKLLLYRFQNMGKFCADKQLVDDTIEPRLNQIFVPLLSIIKDIKTRKQLQKLIRHHHEEQISDRGTDVEAQILVVVRFLIECTDCAPVSVKKITACFTHHFGNDFERQITNRWVGSIIRRKLNLHPRKSNGVYVLQINEHSRLKYLYQRYGVTSEDAKRLASHSTPSTDDLVWEPLD